MEGVWDNVTSISSAPRGAYSGQWQTKDTATIQDEDSVSRVGCHETLSRVSIINARMQTERKPGYSQVPISQFSPRGAFVLRHCQHLRNMGWLGLFYQFPESAYLILLFIFTENRFFSQTVHPDRSFLSSTLPALPALLPFSHRSTPARSTHTEASLPL